MSLLKRTSVKKEYKNIQIIKSFGNEINLSSKKLFPKKSLYVYVLLNLV